MQRVHFQVRVSVFNQRFDSRLPCANSKPISNLSKAVFFILFVPGRGRRQDQRIVRLRAEVPLVSHREERARNLCLAGYSANYLGSIKIKICSAYLFWKHNDINLENTATNKKQNHLFILIIVMHIQTYRTFTFVLRPLTQLMKKKKLQHPFCQNSASRSSSFFFTAFYQDYKKSTLSVLFVNPTDKGKSLFTWPLSDPHTATKILQLPLLA